MKTFGMSNFPKNASNIIQGGGPPPLPLPGYATAGVSFPTSLNLDQLICVKLNFTPKLFKIIFTLLGLYMSQIILSQVIQRGGFVTGSI